MYNILIVEDERIIREGIEDIFSSIPEFKTYKAENGLDALQVLKNNKIQGMVLDVRMPKMDGLELLKELHDRGINNIITIVLSGFNEFDFAKQAMRFGVVDYVLKPVAPDDVRKIAEVLMDRIKSQDNREKEIERLREQVEESKPLIRERFFHDLLNRKISRSQYIQKQKFIDIDFQGDFFQVVLIELDEGQDSLLMEDEENYQILIMSINNLIQQMAGEYRNCQFFHLSTGMFVLLFCYCSEEEGDKSYELVENMIARIKDNLKVSLSAGVGGILNGMEQIRDSYDQAQHALSYRMLLGKENIISIWDIENRDNYSIYSFNEEEFISKVKLNQKKEAVNYLNEIFVSIKRLNQKADLNSLNLLCMRIITASLLAMEQSNGTVFYQGKTNNPFIEFLKLKSLDEVIRWIIKFVTDIADNINGYRNSKSRSIIEKAKGIINEGYKKDLTIKYLADRLYLSKNYFGQLFKDEVGMSVNEYLNMVRIKKAKDLLTHSALKVYEIAYETGFNDQHYFSSVFKKLVGVSPSEYRDLL